MEICRTDIAERRWFILTCKKFRQCIFLLNCTFATWLNERHPCNALYTTSCASKSTFKKSQVENKKRKEKPHQLLHCVPVDMGEIEKRNTKFIVVHCTLRSLQNSAHKLIQGYAVNLLLVSHFVQLKESSLKPCRGVCCVCYGVLSLKSKASSLTLLFLNEFHFPLFLSLLLSHCI